MILCFFYIIDIFLGKKKVIKCWGKEFWFLDFVIKLMVCLNFNLKLSVLYYVFYIKV